MKEEGRGMDMSKRKRLTTKQRLNEVKLKPRHIFNSDYEKNKVCRFLHNLIGSKFLKYKPKELFEFSSEVLGQGVIIELLKKYFPEITDMNDFVEWVEYDKLAEKLPDKILLKLLKNEVSPYISKVIDRNSPCADKDIQERFQQFRKTFNLTGEELEIIIFFFLVKSNSIIDKYLNSSTLLDFTDLSVLRSHGNIMLGLKRSNFLKAFSCGNLFKAQIIEKLNSNYIGLNDWVFNYLSGFGMADLSHQLFKNENDETLMVSDFDVSREEVMVLNTLLEKGKGQNILFYGSPGSGKTSFAKSLAKKYDKELLTVKIPETDEHGDRLRAIFGTVNLADERKSIVLVDEADEVLNSSESFYFKSKTNKSWVNNLLESHKKTVIWITNRSSEIDQSSMRRFSFSIEFKALNHKRRFKVLSHELRKKGLNNFFDKEELISLCKDYRADAGGVVNAINSLTTSKRVKKERALQQIKTVLKSHEKATSSRRNVNSKERDFRCYSLDWLNTSQNLKNIVNTSQRFTISMKKTAFIYHLALTMLLYGLPGTGKSEFVYYLGNKLGKEVLLKRCSEIESMWVGETEKNIARAFSEAQETGDILFFDEADSFLYPRKDASCSWEKTATNELLTQLESFKGIAIFATNDMDGLDHAAIRRFKFKVEFRPLTPGGNLHFYNKLLKPLIPTAQRLSTSDTERIKSICNLTPGDFAVTKDQALFMEASMVTHKSLINSVVEEVKYKKGIGRSVGF